MGKNNSISLVSIWEPGTWEGSNVPSGTYSFLVHLQIKLSGAHKLKANSVRIYYSETPEIISGTGVPYTTYDVREGTEDTNVVLRGEENGLLHVYCVVPGLGQALDDNTTYWLRSWMQLYKSNGKAYKKYRGPKNPTPAFSSYDPERHKLFQIASYSNPHTTEDGIEYDQSWVNFTDCIIAGSYDVNYEDTNEDWIDANYDTHRIVPKTKIKGSMDLKFTTRLQYNEFLKLIKMNRIVNGLGYVQCKVLVNNDIAILDNEIFGSIANLENKNCVEEIHNFFLKMESNPWVVPFLGHYDMYEPIHIEIEEAYTPKDD